MMPELVRIGVGVFYRFLSEFILLLLVVLRILNGSVSRTWGLATKLKFPCF